MDLLPPSTNETIPEKTGTRFTVRSANSPSYSLTRRSGVRKRPTAENAEKKEDLGFIYQKDINQNDNKRNPPENGTDVGGSLALRVLGRTEGSGSNSGSKSRSLPRTSKFGEPKLQGKTEARGFEEQRTEIEKRSRGGTSYFEDSHSVNHRDFADRVSEANTLPVRFKPESGPAPKLDCLSGLQRGQSIKERIQKLYESAGGTTVGGTFPRRFSLHDDYSPVRKAAAAIWAPKEANPPSSTMLASKQEEPSSKHLEENVYTKSLDRARSRNTIAGRIRSARTAACMEQSQTYEGSILAQRRRSNQEHRTTDMTEINKAQKGNKERDEGTEQQSKHKSGIADDVFYTNPSEGTLQSPEWKKLPETLKDPSSASVRNKISQFEALTQKTGSEVHIPRRTLSVQAQPCQPPAGIKKSGSAKNIGERSYSWETETDGSSEKRMFASVKSLSLVDKSRMSETDSSNLLDKSKNNLSKDLGQYASHKKTLYIPLNEGAQMRTRFLFPEDSNLRDAATSDMPPRSQWDISSPVSDDDKTPTNTPLNTSPFLSPVEEPEDFFPFANNMSLSVTGQEDKTKEADSTLPPPIILSQTSEPDVFITDEEKSKDKDCRDLPPDTAYQNDLSDVFYSNVKAELPKGQKQLSHLKAWIASVNPEYKDWDEYMGQTEDDDEGTPRDDDSNDSDSGDSSATITSNMSWLRKRSFSLSLPDLHNITGTGVESDNDNDDWQRTGRRSASLSSDVSAFSYVSLLPPEQLDKLVEEVKNIGDEELQDYDDVHVVVLHKEEGTGLGFSLAGGVDQNKPVTVHKVFKSGVAAQEGSISEGDHVLSINGTAFSKSTHSEARKTLKRAKRQEMAVVVLRKGDLNQSETQYDTGQRVCIQLEKNSRTLGFSLMEESFLGNSPVTIQKIFPGGPVDKVFPGDEILEIHGKRVVGMGGLEVWKFIQSLPRGPVDVVLQRPLKVTQL